MAAFIVATFCPTRSVRNMAPLPGPSFFSVCGIWPEGPVNAHGIGMSRLVRIIEPRPDLYDELIIDRVIGLGRRIPRFGLAQLKESHYSAVCGQQRANSRSNIHRGEHTSNYPRLNGTGFTNEGGEKRKTEADHRGHLGGTGQQLWVFGGKKRNSGKWQFLLVSQILLQVSAC